LRGQDLPKLARSDSQPLQLARAGRQLEYGEQSLIVTQTVQQRRLQALA
jgi:hypothetical protein